MVNRVAPPERSVHLVASGARTHATDNWARLLPDSIIFLRHEMNYRGEL